jgi:hypothetical protein
MAQRDVEHIRRLEAFCAANYGCPKAQVIREAVQDYIERRVGSEPELRKRYIEALAPLRKLRVVK